MNMPRDWNGPYVMSSHHTIEHLSRVPSPIHLQLISKTQNSLNFHATWHDPTSTWLLTHLHRACWLETHKSNTTYTMKQPQYEVIGRDLKVLGVDDVHSGRKSQETRDFILEEEDEVNKDLDLGHRSQRPYCLLSRQSHLQTEYKNPLL